MKEEKDTELLLEITQIIAKVFPSENLDKIELSSLRIFNLFQKEIDKIYN